MNLFELEAKISLDTSAYDRAVKDATGKAEGVESAFQDVGNASKKAESQTNALGNRLKVVSGLYEEAENRVSELSDALDKSIRETGETSDETRQLASELSKAEKEADSLKSEMDDLADRMEDAGDSSDDLGQTMANAMVKADLFSKGLSLLGEAAMSLASYIWNLDDATEEYRVSQTKLNAAFSTAGFTAGTAKSAFSDLYRAVGDNDRATEASQLLAQLARNTEDVATWTEIATGVVGTFGDALPIETLIESANETARTGQVVGTLADALNWAGEVGEDEFNAMLASCATQEERVQLITETLSATYRDAASAYEETSESVMRARDAHLRLAEAQADVGEEISRLKSALSASYSFSATGFFAMIEEAAGYLADFAESSGKSKDEYYDFIESLETRIQTGSIQDAAQAVLDIRTEIDRLKSERDAGDYSIFGELGIFGPSGYLTELIDLLDEGDARLRAFIDSGEDTAEMMYDTAAAAGALDESLEPVIATAGGLSVELYGTGMTADEASSRLKSYTDAATNMFQRISTESEISYQDAISNLEANIQATENFASDLTEIAGSLPGELAELFAAGGPSMYAGVVSMLAEANRGADEGLTQLNLLWEEGGTAAVDAFLTSLGAVPDNITTPISIVADQISKDTSAEQAAAGAADRTASALQASVTAGGFDSAGRNMATSTVSGFMSQAATATAAGQAFAVNIATGLSADTAVIYNAAIRLANGAIAGLESKSSDASNAGTSIAQNVVTGLSAKDSAAYIAGQNLINQFAAGMSSRQNYASTVAARVSAAATNSLGGSSDGRYSAGGLDYVPYNGYPAILHAGEAVLTASEAQDWRRGQTVQAVGGVVINQYITAVPQTPAEIAAAAQAYFEQARWAV